MTVRMKQKDYEALDGIPLIWACIEPVIRQVRGRSFETKTGVYAQLTSGQQALLMFQILYGHTVNGVQEFLMYQSYMLQNKGTWAQMHNAMEVFGAFDMLRFLDELAAVYEEHRDAIEQYKVQAACVPEDAPLSVPLGKLDARLREVFPAAVALVCTYIRDNAEQFVILEDSKDSNIR